MPSTILTARLFHEEDICNTGTVLAGGLGSLLPLEPVMETIAIVTNPTVSAGKWIGNSSVSVSATDYKNRRRIPPPPRHPNHPGDQSSSRHWIAWCIMSPVTTARWAREEILTQLWQGVTGRRRQPDGVIQSGSSSIVGRKEILRPSPWPFAFNHRVNGNVADFDLPHCRFLLGGDRNSLVPPSLIPRWISGSMAPQ